MRFLGRKMRLNDCPEFVVDFPECHTSRVLFKASYNCGMTSTIFRIGTITKYNFSVTTNTFRRWKVFARTDRLTLASDHYAVFSIHISYHAWENADGKRCEKNSLGRGVDFYKAI
jgi:hypothetical protein